MTNQHDDLTQDLLNTFRTEASDHLEVMNKALLRIERASDEKQRKTLLQEAFRAAHNLKGAARIVSLPDVQELAHALGNVLQRARDGKVELDPATCDVLYAALDATKQLITGQEVWLESIYARLAAVNGEALPVMSREN